MSYLHCPTCACAYNVTREPACPRCGARAGAPADATADIVGAVEQLARAMARATPIEIVAAKAQLDARTAQLALPAPGAPTGPSPQLLRAVRAALEEPAPPPSAPTVIDRLPPELRAAFEKLRVRLAPRLPAVTGARHRIARITSRVRAMFA